MNQPELTDQALAILRSGENFQWVVITLLALVIYVYTNEYQKGNFKGIAAGLALYGVHWFYEIVNALIQHFKRACPLDRADRHQLSDPDRCRH